MIFTDYSLPRIYWWAIRKEVRYAFRQRPEMPPDCPEWKIAGRLMRVIWRVHRQLRPRWLEMLPQLGPSVTVHHFKSPRETEAFLRSLETVA